MDDKAVEEIQQPVGQEAEGGAKEAASQEAQLEEREGDMPPDFRIVELEAQLQQLKGSLEEREASLQKLTAALAEREGAVGGLKKQLTLAVAKYRDALLSSAPEVPPELVQGQTIEEIEAALAQARQIVERIRNQMEAQVASERVPAGAPPRSAPDLSTLSPREKIAYALGRNQR